MAQPFVAAMWLAIGVLLGGAVNLLADISPLGGQGRASLRAWVHSARHIVVLVLCSGGSAALWLAGRGLAQTAWLLTWGAFFLLTAVVDFEHRLVPNANLLLGGAFALATALLRWPLAPSVSSALLGGAVGLAAFFALALVGRGALGAGDVKLAAVIGLAVGFPAVLRALLLGVLFGGVAALCTLLRGLDRRATIPYAPWLALGAYVAMLQAAIPPT